MQWLGSATDHDLAPASQGLFFVFGFFLGGGWRGWPLALVAIVAYSDSLPRPPLFRGAGGMSLLFLFIPPAPFLFIPPAPFKRGGLTRLVFCFGWGYVSRFGCNCCMP